MFGAGMIAFLETPQFTLRDKPDDLPKMPSFDTSGLEPDRIIY